jgi:calcium-dependent protein kinase
MATLDKKRLLDEELLFLAFQHFDGDNDGFISVSDLKKAIGTTTLEFSQDDFEQMIADWDQDHNKQMDYQEFKSMMEASKSYLVPEPVITGPSRQTTRRETVRKTIAKIASPFEV